ncbi:hypothetical protein CONPUDRAFT_160998 [Coniophora puteana RWD-64-598 SS2]|uniref:F-box domain-containing protein n=1 Tax=Coniophora puteana (strain RWD-64-598) TaxID=741705 RepID=A0A5M3N4J7_CONPW|nr:uncharacterized protein CONPUDRAFT_160998 [Coniophora puteana RWD-64-598 SS2]EIW86177.1 hypothetical protein CONPUDRAFT_160998 [Coniophora puteana RWD-64-598 SS2]
MDKALSLPEIRLQICSQVASQDTLANLARTSTLFRDPALDWLWSGSELTHTSISHIRHVIDPDAIIEGKEYPQYGMIVDLNLNPEDWDRILFYTKRIVFMSIDPKTYTEPRLRHPALLKLLSSPSSLDTAFPRLRHIIAGKTNRTEDLRASTLFFSSRLLSVDIICNPDNGLMVRDALLERCPSLQRLSVLDEHQASDLPASMTLISSTVVRLHMLSALLCYNLSWQALSDISRSSHLRHLVLANQDWNETKKSSPVPKPATLPFPCLQTLELSPPNAESAVELLRRLEVIPRMVKIFGLELSITVDEMQEMFIILSQAPRTYLEELIIDAKHSQTDARGIITMDTLRPLLRHGQLCHLSVDVPHSISLSPEDVRELGQAFPRLDTIRFDSSSDSSMLLDCVLALSCECPRLADITFPLDFSVQTTPSTYSNSPDKPSRLQRAHLFMAGGADVGMLAQTVTAHFPFLTTLIVDEGMRYRNDVGEDYKVVTRACVAPLLQLSGLRVLSLNLEGVFKLTDTDVIQVAEALPRLNRLDIGGWSSDSSSLGVAFDTVIAVTDLCPDLSELTIYVDTTDAFSRSTLEQRLEARQGRRNQILTKLNVLHTRVKGKILGDFVILLAVVYKNLGTISVGTSVYLRPAFFLVDELLKEIRRVDSKYEEIGVQDIDWLRGMLEPIIEKQKRPRVDFNFPDLKIDPTEYESD